LERAIVVAVVLSFVVDGSGIWVSTLWDWKAEGLVYLRWLR
jgi:hypothetical protein